MEIHHRSRKWLTRGLLAVSLGAGSMGLLGAGCEDVASPEPQGRDVFVVEGSDAILATGDRIHFDRVEADSRCPTGLMCFWEGEAKASFSLRPSGTGAPPFTLTIRGTQTAADTLQGMQGFQTVAVGSYHFTLLQLDPYPKSGRDPLTVRSTALIRVEY